MIWSRLLLGFTILFLAFLKINNYIPVAITILTIGLLTDIFDGIIARKMNISTEKLRRMDSTIDQLFFICVAMATYIQCPQFFKSNSTKLIILFSFEAVTYLVSFLKFRKEIATHSIGAKLWTLFLFATLVEIIIHCKADLLFNLCFWTGIITRLEIVAIILMLKKWTNDVPTILHAVKLRKNKPIKRNKLFNG